MTGVNNGENRDNRDNTQPGSPGKSPYEKSPHHVKHVFLGIGILAVLHCLLFLFPIGFFFISIAQIVYLLPAIFVFNKKTGIVQGLLIGAGITFLVNAACFGLLVSGNLSL
ncbi:hypothetical protein PghCCS26_40060 [Paenibacillus glycanilyticus]|uniref:Uncharacterized protein n=1 Tax=Paenibacillus glycanilyticus TaxID=126569 RepID=A0ABQ6NRU8_9BACL|nr:hypothetical protein [Paenibacillus glycanilyticus]GMK46877.1 hypothetical protein PghCCS26_40060 [Paenibacillus glycanilyticus]